MQVLGLTLTFDLDIILTGKGQNFNLKNGVMALQCKVKNVYVF